MSTGSTSLTRFWDKQEHSRILLLALPMIISNATTPLIGLVDTAVLGHMQDPKFLAGASVGALILTQLYWICGFIRMSATGLSAQAKGRNSQRQSVEVLYQSLFIAMCLGLVFILLQSLILEGGLYLASFEQDVAVITSRYFAVRIWGAPAVLANLAIIGWLIGQQCSAKVMYIQVAGNLLNAGLNITFVFVFNLSVEGVALASIFAEYFILLASLWVAQSQLKFKLPSISILRHTNFSLLLKLNNDMLWRNLALQACLAFITFQGARLGPSTAATNAILMQFFVLIALGLDAIAYAVEALIGQGKGQKNQHAISMAAGRGLFWSSVFAIVYSLIFYLSGPGIIRLLTDHASLQLSAVDYLPVIVCLPLLAHWCFLLDGVFIGLTRSTAMRNSMIVSCLLVFFPLWLVFEDMQNWALWLALSGFMLARGASLGGYFIYLQMKGALVN